VYAILEAAFTIALLGVLLKCFNPVHSTYANILKNRYEKVGKHVGIG
jgi:hypothetical protein